MSTGRKGIGSSLSDNNNDSAAFLCKPRKKTTPFCTWKTGSKIKIAAILCRKHTELSQSMQCVDNYFLYKKTRTKPLFVNKESYNILVYFLDSAKPVRFLFLMACVAASASPLRNGVKFPPLLSPTTEGHTGGDKKCSTHIPYILFFYICCCTKVNLFSS